MKFKLHDWFLSKSKRDMPPEWRMGAREYANSLRKIDPRMASEFDAAIDRHEQTQEQLKK